MNPAVAPVTPPRSRSGLTAFTTTWASQIGITAAFLGLWIAFVILTAITLNLVVSSFERHTAEKGAGTWK